MWRFRFWPDPLTSGAAGAAAASTPTAITSPTLLAGALALASLGGDFRITPKLSEIFWGVKA